MFLIFTLLAWRAFKYQTSISLLRDRAILFSTLAAILYGLSDEIHQLYVPGRLFDVLDILADSFGALLFVLGHWFFKRFRKAPETAN